MQGPKELVTGCLYGLLEMSTMWCMRVCVTGARLVFFDCVALFACVVWVLTESAGLGGEMQMLTCMRFWRDFGIVLAGRGDKQRHGKPRVAVDYLPTHAEHEEKE